MSKKSLLSYLTIFTLFVFIAVLTFLAYNSFPTYTSPDVMENFYSAPTRASECNCLPGYIPSNIPVFPFNGTIYYSEYMRGAKKAFDLYYNPKDTKDLYLIPWNGNKCGLPDMYTKESTKKYTPLPKKNSFVNKGNLKCSVVQKIEKTETFFCKNTKDSTKTDKCY
jgi:hypothetical protein